MKPTLLFYTGISRAFHTYLKYCLFKLIECGEFRIILLTEDIYSEDQKGINVDTMISVSELSEKMNRFKLNRRSRDMARSLVERYAPKVIVASSDFHSLFEMYLFRYGHKMRAKNVAIQWSMMAESKKSSEWTDLLNAHRLFPEWIPLKIRLMMTKVRKWLGHYLVYWILPILIKEKPFGDVSSYILKRGISGMREADQQFVLSQKDKDLFIKEGVPKEKIRISTHQKPIITGNDFGHKIITLVVPSEMLGGIRKKDKSYIDTWDQMCCWLDVTRTISKELPEWKIYIRCHPETRNMESAKELFLKTGKNVYWADPYLPPDNAIKKSDVIIGLPPSFSTLLYMASVQFPKKSIVSLDFFDEIMGDYFKDSERIAYIKNKNQLKNYLNQLQ